MFWFFRWFKIVSMVSTEIKKFGGQNNIIHVYTYLLIDKINYNKTTNFTQFSLVIIFIM